MTDVAALYLGFAEHETTGVSACYEEWARGIAEDAAIIALVEELPPAKRQPNLVFGAARHVGARPGPYPDLRAWLLAHWAATKALALERRTQTNEAARDAVMLPLLSALPQPLALIEVGASAGLCLYPDRYSYRYTGHAQLDPPEGPSDVVIDCELLAPAPVPTRLPDVVFRAGVDLHPIDPRDPEEIRWLESLVWPEHETRRERLGAAARIAAREPIRIIAGDLEQHVASLVADAPRDATVVVFHGAVLAYLSEEARRRFVGLVRELGVTWISNEAPGVIDSVAASAPAREALLPATFALGIDGRAVAYASGHGQWLDWFGDAPGIGAAPAR